MSINGGGIINSAVVIVIVIAIVVVNINALQLQAHPDTQYFRGTPERGSFAWRPLMGPLSSNLLILVQ